MSEAAARVAAGDTAAFGVTSGTMILGALLAPKDPAHATPPPQDQREHDIPQPEAETHSTPATTIPIDSAMLPASSDLSHTSDQPAPHALFPTQESTPSAVNPSENVIHGSPDFAATHDGTPPIREAGPASAETSLSGSAAASHSSAADLTSNLNNMVDGLETNLNQTIDALLGSTSELSALWQHTSSQIDHTIGELLGTIENLADTSGLLDLGHTLDNATSGLVDALEIPALGVEHTDRTASASDTTGVMSAIADLAGSLTGVTQHNDTLDQAYGTPAQQNTTPADPNVTDTFDIGSFTAADTGPITMSFMGQSYTDAFDTHDVTHHASQTLHGLV
jgi:hypothetical protein